jgi:DNA polymerase III delta prime subunit
MHHAYVHFGPLRELKALEGSARALFHFDAQHDPDVSVQELEKFGIDEARELKEMGTIRSISGRALYIVGVGTITTEAQQALLKLFEEPQEGVVFVLLAPHGSIIPTLRSRFLEFPNALSGPGVGPAAEPALRRGLAQDFLKASSKERSDTVTKMLKDEDGARERVREFLSALEAALHAAASQAKDKKKLYEGLEDIAKVRSYVGDRSPSLKMLLEHLALSLPTL